jgi:uncharacterized membrane protein YkoI
MKSARRPIGIALGLAGLLFVMAGASVDATAMTAVSMALPAPDIGSVATFASHQKDKNRKARQKNKRRRDGKGTQRDRRPDRKYQQRRRNDQDKARDAVRRGEALPLGTIIRQLQSSCPASFLNATLEERNRRLVYRVRLLLQSGRSVTFVVDASSGAILKGRCR